MSIIIICKDDKESYVPSVENLQTKSEELTPTQRQHSHFH